MSDNFAAYQGVLGSFMHGAFNIPLSAAAERFTQAASLGCQLQSDAGLSQQARKAADAEAQLCSAGRLQSWKQQIQHDYTRLSRWITRAPPPEPVALESFHAPLTSPQRLGERREVWSQLWLRAPRDEGPTVAAFLASKGRSRAWIPGPRMLFFSFRTAFGSC